MFDFNFVTITYIVLIILPIIQFLMFLGTRFKMTDIELDLQYYLDSSIKNHQKTSYDLECLNTRLTSLEDALKQSKALKPKK